MYIHYCLQQSADGSLDLVLMAGGWIILSIGKIGVRRVGPVPSRLSGLYFVRGGKIRERQFDPLATRERKRG